MILSSSLSKFYIIIQYNLPNPLVIIAPLKTEDMNRTSSKGLCEEHRISCLYTEEAGNLEQNWSYSYLAIVKFPEIPLVLPDPGQVAQGNDQEIIGD
jgi:hypothetical protein